MIYRPALIGSKKNSIRFLDLYGIPTTQYNGSDKRPYNLNGALQGFSQATLTMLFNFQADNFVYTYDPNYILESRLNLWSLDADGLEIEQVIANGDLPAWGCTTISGTIHGNSYWATDINYPYSTRPAGTWNREGYNHRAITGPVYICGWLTTVTLTHGTGTTTIPNPVRCFIYNLT